jgi:hypothetical protein
LPLQETEGTGRQQHRITVQTNQGVTKPYNIIVSNSKTVIKAKTAAKAAEKADKIIKKSKTPVEVKIVPA